MSRSTDIHELPSHPRGIEQCSSKGSTAGRPPSLHAVEDGVGRSRRVGQPFTVVPREPCNERAEVGAREDDIRISPVVPDAVLILVLDGEVVLTATAQSRRGRETTPRRCRTSSTRAPWAGRTLWGGNCSGGPRPRTSRSPLPTACPWSCTRRSTRPDRTESRRRPRHARIIHTHTATVGRTLKSARERSAGVGADRGRIGGCESGPDDAAGGSQSYILAGDAEALVEDLYRRIQLPASLTGP